MPTIVEILRRNSEPLPEWLASHSAPTFDRETFFSSRTVYYPGFGDDDQPVKLCALSHTAHTFVYVDQKAERKTIVKRLQDREQAFRGYETDHQQQITEGVLRPGGWCPHVSAEEVSNAGQFRGGFAEPFGLFVVLKRTNGGGDCGPRRLAILFIGGDGFASYDALYCQRDGTPPPYPAIVQDHGFGHNWDRFGGGGLLERIAQRCDVWPEYLLVGEPSKPWTDYKDTGARPEPGGQHAIPRCLCRRNAVQGCG